MADVKISDLTAATASNLADEYEVNQSGTSRKISGTVQQSMPRSKNAQTGTTYTLVAADAGKLLTLSNASAVTVTVPPNSSVPFAVDTQIDLIAKGAGQVTIAAGSGVTINSKGGNLKLSARYSAATLHKDATDTWHLVGDLSA